MGKNQKQAEKIGSAEAPALGGVTLIIGFASLNIFNRNSAALSPLALLK